jgi:putative RNA 2'-phosphotransferase
MNVSPSQLSRLVSYALRHKPWIFELELDDEGWVRLDMLVDAIQSLGPPWDSVGRDDLVRIVSKSSKLRHEISGDRIRAIYGHSVPGRIRHAEAVPPELLFHGTSQEAWREIADDGLRPMGRQYVHLSVDPRTAYEVGQRKSRQPVVLVIKARQAHKAGVMFWFGSPHVWLTDYIPAWFISRYRDREAYSRHPVEVQPNNG